MCHEIYTIDWSLLLVPTGVCALIATVVCGVHIIVFGYQFIKLVRNPNRDWFLLVKRTGLGILLLAGIALAGLLWYAATIRVIHGVTFRLDSETIAEVQIHVYRTEQPRDKPYQQLGTVVVTDRQAICELIRLLHQSTTAEMADQAAVGWFGRQYYRIHFQKTKEPGRHGEEVVVIVEDNDRKQMKILKLNKHMEHSLAVFHNPAVCDWVVDQVREQFPPPTD